MTYYTLILYPEQTNGRCAMYITLFSWEHRIDKDRQTRFTTFVNKPSMTWLLYLIYLSSYFVKQLTKTA